MKKLYTSLFLSLIFIQLLCAQKSPAGDIWLHMLTTGQPAATKYLGDQLNAGSSWFINFEIGQDSWNQSDAGVGLSNTDPSAWTWRTANWYANGGGSNKMVRSDFGDFRFTSTGNWYFAGRAKAASSDPWHYANSDGWGNASNFNPIYYFTVQALNNPGSQTAVVNSSNPASQVDLSWAKDAQNHNVMIVRKRSFESWTEPTQGTAYSAGATIGDGVVVYNSNGTTFSNTGLNSSTGYDYKFYSENYNYYSAGVTTGTVTTSTAPADYFRSKASSDWTSVSTWESSFDNTHWVGSTAVPASTSNIVTIKSGNSVSVNTAATVNALTIESGAVLSVPSSNSLTVNGAFINGGTASALVLESGASLITNGTVSGSATVKRDITSDNKWHFLSAPVSGQNICDGNFAPTAANFNPATGATFDFYQWSEATVPGNLNWINLKNADFTLNTAAFGTTPQFVPGKGYLVAYGPSFSGSMNKSFAGNLVSGDQTLTLGNTGNTWNLAGNPFASAIDWDGVNKSGLDGGYYYIYNENKAGGPGYESYLDAVHSTAGANGKISAMQGFFVKALGTSLVLPNAARVHNNNWMKDAASVSSSLKVKLSSGVHYDEAYVIFEETGTIHRDFYDALKLMSMDASIPQVYSMTAADDILSINSMPFSLDEFSIQLGTYFPESTDYSIDISGLESFPMIPSIVLEDKKLNVFQDIVDSPVYSFSAGAGEDPARFVLHFAGVTAISEPTAAGSVIVTSHGGTIRLINSGNSACSARLYDASGRSIGMAEVKGGCDKEFTVGKSGGVYLMRIETPEGCSVRKVILN